MDIRQQRFLVNLFFKDWNEEVLLKNWAEVLLLTSSMYYAVRANAPVNLQPGTLLNTCRPFLC